MKIIKIPFSAGSLHRSESAELGPDAVLAQMEDLFLNESGINPKFEVDEVKVNPANIAETFSAITEKIKQIKEKAIIIGGDHSITYATFKAFAQDNPGAGLIVLDAHPDLETGLDIPTHEDYPRALIKEGLLDKNKLIILGVRNMHGYETDFIEMNRINVFTMKKISEMGVQEVCSTVMETANKWPALYLSIDIDAVDPAFAPGTGCPEVGGFSSREIIYILQRFKLLKNLKMIDLVEIAPKKDIAGMTSKLGGKIVKEMYSIGSAAKHL